MALDQIGTMLSPCSPRIRAVTCVGAALQLLGDQAAEADRVELRAEADAPALGGRSSRSAARYVSTSTGFETTSTIGVLLDAGLADLGEDAEEQVDVAVDQVEPAFVRLAAQAGRDADHVARRDVLVAAGGDHLVGHARRAVQQVERLAGGQFGVDVEQGDLADDAAASAGRMPRTSRPVRRRR